MIRVEALTGANLEAALEDVARLRISVFRAWPYLYDGDPEYERTYLETYARSEDAIVVGAFDGAALVGAATGTSLLDHSDDFSAAFDGTAEDLDRIFYCAESVLLPEYRGQGVGQQFFALREAHAIALGKHKSAFCGVLRPWDHPARPESYVPLDGFWRRRGYRPLAGAVARFKWKDLGEDAETAKSLQFWIRTLEPEITAEAAE